MYSKIIITNIYQKVIYVATKYVIIHLYILHTHAVCEYVITTEYRSNHVTITSVDTKPKLI